MPQHRRRAKATSAKDADRSPKIRELPGPREQKGLIAPALRVIFAWPYRAILAGLYRAGFRPWQLTIFSLAVNALCGWLIVTGRFLLSGLLLIPAGMLDVFDGALARQRGEASRAGAFLDSVIDRASDVILFGAIFWAFAADGGTLGAALALVSLLVSLSVSYIRAQAESLGLTLTEGLMQRLERYVALMVGLLFPGMLVPVLMLLAVLGGVTMLQRIWSAWRQLPASRPRARRAAA
jgi:CDP-diacylglycerol--glycerol-3-phosphate 3-phosphatidyltransferase